MQFKTKQTHKKNALFLATQKKRNKRREKKRGKKRKTFK